MSAARDLQALYTRHHRLVRWIVHASGVPERSVDDVIQDVFVTIHRRRAQAPDGDLRRWIVGVTRSVCHSHRRAAARRRDRLARLHEPEAEASLERSVEAKRAMARLDGVLGAIDPDQREAWILVELEGFSAPEAAEALGANVNTIYSRVRLARRRIEAAFADTTAERLRAAGDPGRERARGVWAGIALRLPPTAALAPLASTATTTSAIGWLGGMTIGAAIGAGVLGAVAWARAPTPRSPRERGEAAARSSFTRGDPAAIEGPQPREPERASTGRPERAEAIAQAPHEGTSRRGRQTARARPGSAHAAPAASAPEARAAEPTSATLAEESRLLRDAARAIDRGALDEATRLLDLHARDHEHGTLSPERERLRDRCSHLRASEGAP